MRSINGIALILLATLVCIQQLLAADSLSLVVPGKTIELSTVEWKKLKDETNFAKNYLEKTAYPWHKYKRVVTVYLIPMSNDRRIGLNISDREYVEFFVAHSGFVTAQTRVDKDNYWVLCRETFNPKVQSPVDISAYKPFLSKNENIMLRQLYQVEIDETRHLLNSKF